ncbi:aspartyl protease family protein 1-like [Zingiber officinale]|uniref:aspartyl protease family protein 1-like n=1 Tax=Zingiber officinale TaxID=94328 RepID=UPI001C4BBDAC|nr:aspartyl protease family protein 1-like [Zingiber officinale]
MAAALRLLLVLAPLAAPAASAGLGFDFHHRFSDPVRRFVEAHGGGGGGAASWPGKGTAEYYSALARHDRRRSLPELSFADSNATFRISQLGFLHYAIVALGTPNVTFLVALDTGSDLFWVPCDCRQCAPTTSPSYGDIRFDIYSPSSSSTSQTVSCSNSLCDRSQSSCSGANSTCPYSVRYVSSNTSSSGVLVEDVLYFTTENTAVPQIVQAQVVFGCGQVQTGSFLDGAAPNGLFGLGMENISVPSILYNQGHTSNSFSMCFGDDGFGRINFGDNGSTGQQETPFVIDRSLPYYAIGITGIVVGNSSIQTSFRAVIDSGTSFTYLADPMYTELVQSFNSQVQDQPSNPDPRIPFEYCYDVSPNQDAIVTPNISFTTSGGDIFPVNDPIILFTTDRESVYMYCLAVNRSDGMNIFGQNFMTGLRIVFDRERMALGWMNFDCGNSTDTPEGPNTTPLFPVSRPPSSGSVKHKMTTRALFALFLILTTSVVLSSRST